MIIAVDAMGGDNAPEELIKGAVAASTKQDIKIALVGNPDVLEEELGKIDAPNNVSVVPALDIIGMDEHPVTAIRKKKDASIVVATELVKQGKAKAIVSAGSTGAQMAAALFGLGRIKNIERPAIVTVIPTAKGGKLLLDVGANVDSKPKHLSQFAQMGSVYAEKILKIHNPKIALLNIGEEATKGNELAIETYELLSNLNNVNFIGNIEGRDILSGNADVIVCDGFVGNIVLKFAEGLSSTLFNLIKEKLQINVPRRLGALLAYPAFKEIKKSLDYSEYGGAPLLGVNGVSIICHGSSNAKAIENAIFVAKNCVESDFIEKIKESI